MPMERRCLEHANKDKLRLELFDKTICSSQSTEDDT